MTKPEENPETSPDRERWTRIEIGLAVVLVLCAVLVFAVLVIVQPGGVGY